MLPLLALAFLLRVRTSLAEVRLPSILLFNPKGALSGQIRAELTALGFRVVPREEKLPEAPAAAGALARALDASAGAYVLATRSGVDVWLLGSASATSAPTHVFGANASEAPNDRLLAVRLAELVRAKLLALELPHGAPEDRGTEPRALATPSPALPAAPLDGPDSGQRSSLHPVTNSLLFDAGLGASSSMGAVRITPLLVAGAAWRPTPTVSLGLSGAVPLAQAEVSGREGSASVETWQLTAVSRLHLLAERSFRPVVAAGLGLLWFRVEGVQAASAYALRSEQLLVAATHLELGVHWQLSQKFALSSSLCHGLALAKPLVAFADRQVLTLGRPLVTWTLRVEYRAFSSSSRD